MAEEKDVEKVTKVVAEDAESIPPTISPKPSGSRPHKRGRTEEDPEPVEETSTEVEAQLVSWLQEGFEMPSDRDGLYDLSVEIASVPKLTGFNIHSRDPDNSLIGAGIIERTGDKAAIAEVEELDIDLSLNFAGLQICGVRVVASRFTLSFSLVSNH